MARMRYVEHFDKARRFIGTTCSRGADVIGVRRLFCMGSNVVRGIPVPDANSKDA